MPSLPGNKRNAADLEAEIKWLSEVIDARMKIHFGQESSISEITELAPPNLKKSSSHYAALIQKHQMSFSERICLILALTPHLRPALLDIFQTKNVQLDRPFTEFGGIREKRTGNFIRTG